MHDVGRGHMLINLNRYLKENAFLVLAFLGLLFVWFLARAPFFFEFPIINYPADWNEYYKIFESILNGTPQDEAYLKRSPLFQIVAAAIHSIFGSHFAIILVMSIFRLVAVLTVVWVSFLANRVLGYVVALAMAGYLAHPWVVHVDLMMLPDTFFAGLELLCVAFLVLAVVKGRIQQWLIAGVFFSLALATKGSSIYLLVLGMIALMARLAIAERVNFRVCLRSAVAFFILPILAYNLLCLNNYIRSGTYTATVIGSYAIVANSFPMWQTSSEYDPRLNRIIEQAQEKLFDCETDGECRIEGTREEFLEKVYSSVSLTELHKSDARGFLKVGITFSMHNLFLPYREEFLPDVSGRWLSVSKSDGLSKASKDAIRNHPRIYARKVLSQLRRGFYNLDDADFHCETGPGYAPYCADNIIARANFPISRWGDKSEFLNDPELFAGKSGIKDRDLRAEMPLTDLETGNFAKLPFTRAYSNFVRYYVDPVFNWSVLNVLPWVSLLVVFLLFFWRSKRQELAVLLIVSCAAMGLGTLIALVQSVGVRDTVSIMGFRYWVIGIYAYLALTLLRSLPFFVGRFRQLLRR